MGESRHLSRRAFFTVIIMQRSRAIPPFASLMTVSSNAVSRAVGRPTRRRILHGFPSYFLRTADYESLNARQVRHDD